MPADARHSCRAVRLGNCNIWFTYLEQVHTRTHTATHTHTYPVPRYPVDLPVSEEFTSPACLPPLMVQVLPGVTRVPIFPKGRAVGSNDTKTASSITVSFDNLFRLIMHAPTGDRYVHGNEKRKPKIIKRFLFQLLIAKCMSPSQSYVSTAAEAGRLAAGGRPPVSGAIKIRQNRHDDSDTE